MFKECGQIVDCRVCGDPNSAMRFAFIEFCSEDGVQSVRAICMSAHLVPGMASTAASAGSNLICLASIRAASVPDWTAEPGLLAFLFALRRWQCSLPCCSPAILESLFCFPLYLESAWSFIEQVVFMSLIISQS